MNFFFCSYQQVPGGLVFPDKATLVVSAIEDSEYKEDKINCEFEILIALYLLVRVGQCVWVRHELH